MDAGEQFALIEWLGQVAKHAGVQCLGPHPLIGIGCDQNGGNGLAGRDQPIMEFEPAHPRHLHICDQAGGAVPTSGPEKAFARRESRCGKAKRSHQTRHRLPNRAIIIDDRNHSFVRQVLALPMSEGLIPRGDGPQSYLCRVRLFAGKDRLAAGIAATILEYRSAAPSEGVPAAALGDVGARLVDKIRTGVYSAGWVMGAGHAPGDHSRGE